MGEEASGHNDTLSQLASLGISIGSPPTDVLTFIAEFDLYGRPVVRGCGTQVDGERYTFNGGIEVTASDGVITSISSHKTFEVEGLDLIGVDTATAELKLGGSCDSKDLPFHAEPGSGFEHRSYREGSFLLFFADGIVDDVAYFGVE